MITCPHCEESNMEGALLCEICGQDMTLGQSAGVTLPLDTPSEGRGIKVGWGTGTLHEYTRIGIHIEGNEQPVVVKLDDTDFLIGRLDSASARPVDLDLTPYDGFDKGVSRNHIELYRSDEGLMAVDLGSVNGTYLNEWRLPEGEPYLIRDGDAIRLGTLVLEVYFM